MRSTRQKRNIIAFLGIALSLVALAGYAYAKGGGHGGGGHHGGGHHGGHHSSHHHSGHHSHHNNHHHNHHVHHHHHHYYHHDGWRGWGGYGGWGWGTGFWGLPSGYPDSAPYAVPYADAEATADVDTSADDAEDDDADDEAGSDDDEDEDADNEPNGLGATAPAIPQDRGALSILLPTADATVQFDGEKMIGFGKERFILTPKIDGEFKFQLQATWTEGGKRMTQVREGRIRAGQKAEVDFTRPDDSTGQSRSSTAEFWKSLVAPLLSVNMR
jgi:uncharacterized protein (TIGR03000 family)